jgi:hypothetical protein
MKRLCYLLTAVLTAACSSIDCPVQTKVTTQYEVYDAGGVAYAIPDTFSVISERKDGSDTILLNMGVDQKSFSIPISYSHPEDVLYFVFEDSEANRYLVDTVWIKKDDIPHFESVDCQASFFHELKSVRHTTNAIDSIIIKNTTVDYDTKTVHFYLYPKIDD